MDADIGVIGVGTMGSMALWQLARRGASVVGFEQFGIGHDRSAVGGETRLFRMAYKEGTEYVPLLQESYKQWLELEKETGHRLLDLTGGLTIGQPDSEEIRTLLKSIKLYNLDHEVLSEKEAKFRFPQHRLLPGEIVVLDKQAGVLRPELAVVSAVERARELGAIVYSHTRVEKITPVTDGVKIQANGVIYKVRKALISVGPWLMKFFPNFKSNININRIVMSWFPIKQNPERYKADKFPVFNRKSNNMGVFGAPTIDNTMVKVALSGRTYGPVENPDYLNRTVYLEELESIRNAVRDFLPDLYPDPVRLSVHMDLYTSDKYAIIGQAPGLKNTIIISGFSGRGFKMSTVMGEIAADLLLNGKTIHKIDPFSPNRFL